MRQLDKERIKEFEKEIRKEDPTINKTDLNIEVLRRLRDNTDYEKEKDLEEEKIEKKKRKYQYQEIKEEYEIKNDNGEMETRERLIATDFKMNKREIKEILKRK